MNRKTREANDMKIIGRVVRATRKQLGLSQAEFAKILNVEQGALSRIESAKQNLTTPQWIELCRATDLSMESIRVGYIEFDQPMSLQHADRVGSFRIPAQYAKNRGSKIRAALPFLNYFREQLGEAKLEDYLRNKKLDPDFFMNLDNQINIGFTLDLCEALIEKNSLKPKDLSNLVKPVHRPNMHGRLRHEYDTKRNFEDLTLSLLRNVKHYNCNYAYAVEARGKRNMDLSITPKEHAIIELKSRKDSLGNLMCRYQKMYLNEFSTYGACPRHEIKELECYYEGHDKCVYQINTGV